MNKRRAKAIRKRAAELCPNNPRWAARWMRRHRDFNGTALPAQVPVTRFASWLRVVWPKRRADDKRTGSFKDSA